MATRTTQEDVLALIPDTSLTTVKIQIMMANSLVNDLALSSCGSSFDAERLRLIEMSLAAHFATRSDNSLNLIEEKVEGSTSKINRGNTGNQSGIMSTSFGQDANTLSNGCLQELEKRKVSFFCV